MVLGLRAAAPPPETRPVEIQLLPPLEARTPVPQPVPQSGRQAQRPALKPHVSPAPAIPLAPLTLPEVPKAAAPAPEVAGPVDKGLKPGLSGRLGCDDPLGFHLTEAQLAVCQNNLGATARTARPLDLNISDANRQAYDRTVRCHGTNGGAMPQSDAPSNGAGGMKGLGYIQTLKDCPPSSR